MRRCQILFLVLILSGCNAIFYTSDDFPGGSGSAGGNTPQLSTTSPGLYANDNYSVNLSYSPDAAATIYYTLDNSDPTASTATPFNSTPFSITTTTTLKAVASNNGVWSAVLSTNMQIGDGSPGNPYSITEARHLHNVRSNLTAHFRQDAHIDLSGGDYTNWIPIGKAGAFKGHYQGNSYLIKDLSVNMFSPYGGLFGKCESAVLNGIHLENATIISTTIYTAILCGYFSSGRIENCTATGTITGTAASASSIGGLVGELCGSALLKGCHAGVNITAPDSNYVGGLIGYMDEATVEDSFTDGDVNSKSITGGLIGSMVNSTLSNCHSLMTVDGKRKLGGLVGIMEANSSLFFCYAQGFVNGTDSNCGGLVGSCDGAVISNCYATGNVHAHEVAGGLVGKANGDIWLSYSTSRVTINDKDNGGLIGEEDDNITFHDCYWDTDTSGLTNATGDGTPAPSTTGLTTADMKNATSYTGWDFTSVWIITPGSYPHFRW